MAGETWGTTKATVESGLQDNQRTVGPFSEVIHEYKTHLRKSLRHGTSSATAFFERTIETLTAINQS